jgi:hypothetical protein
MDMGAHAHGPLALVDSTERVCRAQTQEELEIWKDMDQRPSWQFYALFELAIFVLSLLKGAIYPSAVRSLFYSS